MEDTAAELALTLVDFVDAARQCTMARAMDDDAAHLTACDKLEEAKEKLIDLTGSLDILLPLLKHNSSAVRLKASSALMGDHREEAVAVLKQLDLCPYLEVSLPAAFVLWAAGEASCGTNFEKPNVVPHVFLSKRRAPRST